jgi:hypothetical protein
MMTTMKHLMFVLALAGCTKASTANETPSNETGRDRGAAPRAKASVTLTSVTFADDCGGTAPYQAPPSTPAKTAAVPASPSVVQEPADVAARRRCEQTSMQLAIVGAAANSDVRIKSVEVFDENGKAIGMLAASKPTRWVDAKAAYEAWDEKVEAAQTARVSYVLSQPDFVNRWDSHDRTYTVKVVASVGGVDQPLQTTVMVVAQPAPVPT